VLRVAVLVACHDDGATIRETVDSVQADDVELVVVDDGSRDPETLAALAELEQEGVAVRRQENHGGPSAAWMNGLRSTAAAYVMPFSSDDLLCPGATKLLADALDANPGAGFAWGDIQTFGLADAYRPSVPQLCPWLVTYANVMPAYSLFRRSLLLETGGWEEISASEDWDLWMRLARRGAEGVYVAQPVYRYRRTAGGRFRRRGRRYESFYEELRTRNAALLAARAANRRASPAPAVLKFVVPLVDMLPGVPRLKKMQLTEAVALLFWTAGLRRTIRVVWQGVAFRVRAAAQRFR
jgi:glycosyltransferase involved in cell wall biosynthesis